MAKRKKKHSLPGKIFRGLATALFFLVMVLLFTGMTVGVFFYANASKIINAKEPIVNLETERLRQKMTTTIYADDGKIVYATLHGDENRVWQSLSALNPATAINPTTKRPMITDAYVALEDKRFYEHHGVDWRRFIGVITAYNFSQGASTLTQQLIKNITGEKDVTIIRKYNEILTALNLENHASKEQIVEAYINTVYLGRGCYGVTTGADRYFGKKVDELNIAECASLAAITKAPNKYDPIKYPENNKERQEYCLREMRDQELITQAQYNEAIAFQLEFTPTPKKENSPTAQPENINNYYVDYIIETVAQDLMKQEDISRADAIHKIYNGGLKIYAAVDVKIQETLEEVFRKRVTFANLTGTKSNPINPAMAIMDYEGRVVAIVGQAGKKTDNRTLNRAFQSWRPPGSTIKPLSVYGPAIEKNLITWSTLQSNSAFAYRGEMWPHNVDGTYGSGQNVTSQYAVMQSLNTVAARTVKEKLGGGNDYRGAKAAFDYLSENFGFAKLDDVNDLVLPAMAVGGMTNGFSPLEECAAYAAFGNGGVYYSPYCYTLVTDSDRKEVLKNKQVQKRAFSEDTAKIMNEMLRTVDLSFYITNGNNNYLGKFKRFGKTGTTNDNKDRWFAGGTPYYVASCRFGYDTPIDLGQLTNPAAKIWTEVFNRIHKDLGPSKAFPKTTKAVQKTYCKITGNLAGANCYSTASGWYRTENLPKTCTTCTGAPVEPATTPDEDNTVGSGLGSWIDQILGRTPTTAQPATTQAYAGNDD